jgi:hypothetical protein
MGALFYLVLTVVVILILFLMALTHAGYFYDLRIRTSIPLSLSGRVAYKLYRGSYTNAGAAFREIAQLAPHLKAFGIYYDDPKRVSWESVCLLGDWVKIWQLPLALTPCIGVHTACFRSSGMFFFLEGGGG